MPSAGTHSRVRLFFGFRYAARYRTPSSYPTHVFTDAGGLMSYGDNRRESFRQAGIYVGGVLKGDKPSDPPVLQPTTFELVVNMKTARVYCAAIDSAAR